MYVVHLKHTFTYEQVVFNILFVIWQKEKKNHFKNLLSLDIYKSQNQVGYFYQYLI